MAPGLDAGFRHRNGHGWVAVHDNWLMLAKNPGQMAMVSEIQYVCPDCTPGVVTALHAERDKHPRAPCAVCGAPFGQACTPSCDDDSVPAEKVKKWMPETFPSELDLLAADE